MGKFLSYVIWLDSALMLFCDSGSSHDRTWECVRMSLLPDAFVSAPVCADKYWDWGAAVGWVLKILRKNYADIIGDFEHSAFQVGCSKSRKIKVCKEAAAPSQRRFALARIIVC